MKRKENEMLNACIEGEHDVVAFYLKKGVNPMFCDPSLGNTPLILASGMGNESTVAEILPYLKEKDFNFKNVMGYTAESIAKRFGFKQCAQMIAAHREKLVLQEEIAFVNEEGFHEINRKTKPRRLSL